jgi:broad specificity phosphatase PhoE
MTLYIIRHGKSVANSLNIVNGKRSDALTKEGIEQMHRLKKKIEAIGIKPKLFYTTDWLRAQQSAKILWPDANWIVEPRLGETDAGEAATLTVDQFNQIFPTFHDTPHNCYPNGESHIDLNKRVISWLEEIKTKLNDEEDLVLVAHAGPISCIWQHILGIAMSKFPAFLQPNASLSIIRRHELTNSDKQNNVRFNFINFE